MISYAAIDRIEGNIAICELETIDIVKSKPEDFFEKETIMVDIELSGIPFEVKEGDIIVVLHNNGKPENIMCKDEKEKQKRIKLFEGFTY